MAKTSFSGWTALVTGASAGLGAEFARQLASQLGNGRLILTARRQDRLESIAANLRAEFPSLQISVEAIDLGQTGGPEALGRRMYEQGIHVDLLINNAGLGDIGPFCGSDWERVASMLAVNVHALTRLTHLFLPSMVARKRGAILQIGSVAGYLPLPTFAVYAATKAYVNSFSEALHWEVRQHGVNVMAVCPGPVPTEFGDVARRPGVQRAVPAPGFVAIDAAQVVRESLAAVKKGKPRLAPGFWMKVSTKFLDILPLPLLRISYRSTKVTDSVPVNGRP